MVSPDINDIPRKTGTVWGFKTSVFVFGIKLLAFVSSCSEGLEGYKLSFKHSKYI